MGTGSGPCLSSVRTGIAKATRSAFSAGLAARVFPAFLLLLMAGTYQARAAFDFDAWKTQYGGSLSPVSFYSTRPGSWGDYFGSTNTDCAIATAFHLGPLGVNIRPYDQALATDAFNSVQPGYMRDSGGLIANSLGVKAVVEDGPSDGQVYPDDVIVEMEGQPIKTATSVSFPFTVLSQSSRGLEIHAGQLVDAAEGRGKISLKVVRAALTAASGSLTGAATSSEMTVDVTGKDYVRLVVTGGSGTLTNWLYPRLEGSGMTALYLNAQTVNQSCGFSSRKTGADAASATVYDGATVVTNVIGTKHNSMVEYAVPAGYTTLKFKVQTTTAGAAINWKAQTRLNTVATTPYSPRKYAADGLALLPPELASYMEDVEYDIPQIGSFGSVYDPTSDKVVNFGKIMAYRLALDQNADGSWPNSGGYAGLGMNTAMAGLGLLSTGDPQYDDNIRRAAYYCATYGTDWSYGRGVKLMLLSEYYLRTKDTGILPALQTAVDEVWARMLPNGVWGHGSNPGYGGGAYLGGTGPCSAGLAIAKRTPVYVDQTKFNQMLDEIQMLAGHNGGRLPYGRGSFSGSFPTEPSVGQGGSCANGGSVLAMKICGGPQYITELYRKKYGAGTYGSADGGHASEALTFIMGSLACAIFGDEAHRNNMNTYLWRLTLKRDFSGWINMNTNRLEYHGGDGGCHGGASFDTGAYLVLMNEHKHNMAITGKPEYMAQTFQDVPPTTTGDKRLYIHILSNWEMVSAALGTKMPPQLLPKLATLRSMTTGTDMASRLLAFLEAESPAAAQAVNAISGLTSPEKQYYVEMLLGIGHKITVDPSDSTPPTTGLANHRLSLNGFTPTTLWDSFGGPTVTTDPAPSTRMTGSVTLTDPSGLYLTSPLTLNFAPGTLNPNVIFQVPIDQETRLNAAFNYTTAGGTVGISYNREIIIHPVDPIPSDGRNEDFTNYRKIWIPGTGIGPHSRWNLPIKLPSGAVLPGASIREGAFGFYAYDNGVRFPADSAFSARMDGTPCGYWVASSNWCGEVPVLGLNILTGPALTTTVPGSITSTSATAGGNVTADYSYPVTARGVCWSASPYPTLNDSKTADGRGTGSFTSSIIGLEPGVTYHVRAYATNAVGTSYGDNEVLVTLGDSSAWTAAGGGSWAATANWQGGVDASGADGVASFTNAISSAATLTLDGSRSIGGMVFGNASSTADWTLSAGTGGVLTLDIGTSGDPTVTVNYRNVTVNTVLAGDNGLLKAGTGTLTLAAANTYNGVTAVTAGTLRVDGSISAGGSVTVASGTVLMGAGSIGGATTVNGTLSPGASGIGTLTVANDLTLTSGAVTTMEISKTSGACDKVAGVFTMTYAGTLTVTNLSGTLAVGDSFTLFSASSYSGSFTTLNLPALTGGLKWDTSKLAVNGCITVGYDVAITTQPSNQSADQGVSATFTVAATGVPSPTYSGSSARAAALGPASPAPPPPATPLRPLLPPTTVASTAAWSPTASTR